MPGEARSAQKSHSPGDEIGTATNSGGQPASCHDAICQASERSQGCCTDQDRQGSSIRRPVSNECSRLLKMRSAFHSKKILIDKIGIGNLIMATEEKISNIETQIMERRKIVDFDTREFTIEHLVKKYSDGIDTDENDIFVPDYQREFVWDDERQSKLIESIVLGLPIPIIFLAQLDSGRLEIVDGSQRIRTIVSFMVGELVIIGLENLTEMNGIDFNELPLSRKRKIRDTAIRTVVLSEAATADVRSDLFERINRGSEILRNMEKRKGIYKGEFTNFIYEECVKNTLLIENTKLAKSVRNRQELEELVLRFFALSDSYPNLGKYSSGVGTTLDEYMEKSNVDFNENRKTKKRDQFQKMLSFVDSNFPNGFSRTRETSISRLFFETISVGVNLALMKNPNLKSGEVDVTKWLSDPKFKILVSTERKTHDQRKLTARIEYVRDYLLAR